MSSEQDQSARLQALKQSANARYGAYGGTVEALPSRARIVAFQALTEHLRQHDIDVLYGDVDQLFVSNVTQEELTELLRAYRTANPDVRDLPSISVFD